MNKWYIRISRPIDDPLSDCLKITIAHRDGKDKLSVGLPIVFAEVKEGSCIDPTLIVPAYNNGGEANQFLRSLVTELKQNGLELNLEVEGELKATKVHLEDMRKLVFDTRKDTK